MYIYIYICTYIYMYIYIYSGIVMQCNAGQFNVIQCNYNAST